MQMHSTVALAFATMILAGCDAKPVSQPGASSSLAPEDEIAIERQRLSDADRALVEAQEWCVVSMDERLGSMGAPIKLMIKGQPVFVCCSGCRKKAEADPDRTLSKCEELKVKVKSAKDAKR